MEPAIVASIIAGTFSLLVAIYNFQVARRQHSRLETLEQTRAQLSRDADANRARLDYEYEARKRLYTTFEPAMFQLLERSQFALDRIGRLCLPETWQELAAPGEEDPPPSSRRTSMAAPKYELISMLYALYSPMVLIRIMRRKLTLFDLSLDRRIELQHYLGSKLYGTFTEDFEFAALKPALIYTPFESDWRQKRLDDPARFWWQGLTMGRLEGMLDSMTIDVATDEPRLASFGEFELYYEATFEAGPERNRKTLAAAANALNQFTPESRPTFCRMAATQARIYSALIRTRTIELPARPVMADWKRLFETGDPGSGTKDLTNLCRQLQVEPEIVEFYLQSKIYEPRI